MAFGGVQVATKMVSIARDMIVIEGVLGWWLAPKNFE